MWFVKLADYFDSSGRLVVGDSDPGVELHGVEFPGVELHCTFRNRITSFVLFVTIFYLYCC